MAMDALNQLQSSQADAWSDLCLANADRYLEGSKAPDIQFKDFRNHVMHVKENHWGGAVPAAERWYNEFVTALKAKRWSDAVYASGVLSHYYTDPIQPLHTAQCEAEGVIHQACEWSIACAYRELTDLLETNLGGWPTVSMPGGANWLGQMVTEGAELANPHYDACMQHYNLKLGAKNPPQGLDQDLRIRFATLIGHAVVGFARIVDRGLEESQAEIPATNLTLQTVMSTITIPIKWITKKIGDAKERALIESIYNEYQQTGKVVESLSEDDKAVREVHAAEVRKISTEQLDQEPVVAIGAAHGTLSPELKQSTADPKRTPTPTVESRSVPAAALKPVFAAIPDTSPSDDRKPSSTGSFTFSIPPHLDMDAVTSSLAAPTPSRRETSNLQKRPQANRYYLNESMDVEKAPSIGPKTAEKLREFGVETVRDLLRANELAIAVQFDDRSIKQQTIVDWQDQARLCCDVPNLRGHDAQILVATGIRNRTDLAAANSTILLKKVEEFAQTSAGKRVLRSGHCPDAAEVLDWISWAKLGASSNAA